MDPPSFFFCNSLVRVILAKPLFVGCFESSRNCIGMGVHLRYFVREGSLKAQGGISSWVPELDPKSLGDTNAGERFLLVPSIGREAERAFPVCLKYCHTASGFLLL